MGDSWLVRGCFADALRSHAKLTLPRRCRPLTLPPSPLCPRYVDVRSVTGFTALHYAAAAGGQGHFDVARTLVERWGADLSPLTRCVG